MLRDFLMQLTRQYAEQFYQKVKHTLMSLRFKGYGAEIARHDLSVLMRFNRDKFFSPETHFVRRVFSDLHRLLGYDRMGIMQKTADGTFEFILVFDLPGIEIFEPGDEYQIDESIFENVDDFIITQELDPQRYSILIPIRDMDENIIRVIGLEITGTDLHDEDSVERDVLRYDAMGLQSAYFDKIAWDQSAIDPLTKLYKRDFILRADTDYFGELKQIAVIDIDHFKTINTKYTESGGDRALEYAASIIERFTRDADIARWGGEEFWIGFGGEITAEKVKERCEEMNAYARNNPLALEEHDEPVVLSFSGGITPYRQHVERESEDPREQKAIARENFDKNIEQATKNLRQAKEGGRKLFIVK